ncbi:hypothetical protein JGU66_10140 [Myxococcaceae bacterium JPH2]|nr:hypothetical protein [Myxococcaceae bacterium JPH2]
MKAAMKRAGLAAWVLWLVGGATAFAQDDGEAVVIPPPEMDRGCPAKPDVVPFTAMSVAGLPRSGWLAHQAVIPEAKDRWFQRAERSRSGVKPVPEDQARRMGAADPKVPLWVFGKSDAAPCRALPTTWWAVRMGTDEDRQTYLMAEVQVDCDLLPPGRLSGTPVALRQKDAPTGCKLRRPNRTETGKDGDPLPGDMADRVPDHECAPPNCARLWEHFGATFEEGTGAYDLTVSWMERNGRDPCGWQVEDTSLLLLRRPDLTSMEELRPGGILYGGFHDAAGLRYLLSRKEGTLYVYDPARLKSAPKAVRYGSLTEDERLHSRRTLSPCKQP